MGMATYGAAAASALGSAAKATSQWEGIGSGVNKAANAAEEAQRQTQTAAAFSVIAAVVSGLMIPFWVYMAWKLPSLNAAIWSRRVWLIHLYLTFLIFALGIIYGGIFASWGGAIIVGPIVFGIFDAYYNYIFWSWYKRCAGPPTGITTYDPQKPVSTGWSLGGNIPPQAQPSGYPKPATQPQPGYAQPGQPQPGYAQPGQPQPGYPDPGHPHPAPGMAPPYQPQGMGYDP
jgi:hypothetical protein